MLPFSCLALLILGQPSAAIGPLTPAPSMVESPVDALWKTPVVEERRRASSWDQTGGNRDCFVIKPGQRVTLLDHQGQPGTIRRVWFTLGRGAEDYLQTTKLCFQFDGRTTVGDVPVGMLTASGPWRVNDVVTPVVNVMRSRCGNRENPGAGRGSFNLLWPMPFARSARVEVVNDSKTEMTMHYHVDYALHPVERPLWFHATYHREHFTKPAEEGRADADKTASPGTNDYVFADIRGCEGRYVGTVLAVQSHPSHVGKWYEGDDRFLVDGKNLLHGTGTEDYFGMAWGVHRPYAGYDHGATYCERNLTKKDRFFDGRFVLYRWHLVDPIDFATSLRASIEAGHANECAQHYESIALWYGRPRNDENRD